MKRLSGWTRLWLVFAVIVWLCGAWSALTLIGAPPPGPNASAERLCAYHWRRAGFPDATQSVFGVGCPDDEQTVEFVRSAAPGEVSLYWTRLWLHLLGWLITPFFVAGAWIIARWVQRGFQNPKASALDPNERN